MAHQAGHRRAGLAVLLAILTALAGCADGLGPLGFLKPADGEDGATTTTRLVDRDVEAPQVFQVSEAGLWDGRPSLGGVWVAYPGVTDPERVIIRNPANGKFVIGALFRRERENPGPRLQVSSDAAAALGLLAGAPATLDVTALRREEVVEAPTTPPTPILDTAETVATEALPPVPGAGAAPPPPAAAPVAAPPPRTPPAATAPTAAGGRNLLQIGIFSVEANANRAAGQVRATGATVTVRKEEASGKTFWRVLAGPVADATARTDLQAKVKGLGYADAFFVSR